MFLLGTAMCPRAEDKMFCYFSTIIKFQWLTFNSTAVVERVLKMCP